MPTGQSPHFIVSGQEKTQSGDEHRIIGDENETAVTQKKKKEVKGVIYEQVAEEQRAAFEKNKKQYNLRVSQSLKA